MSHCNISDISTDPASAQFLRIACKAPMTTKHTTTISTQTTEFVKLGTVRTTGDTTTHTDSKTDTSKKVENLSITTDPTTGKISIVNAVNLDNAKSKGQQEYLIIFLEFNFQSQTTVKNVEVSFNYLRTTCILYLQIRQRKLIIKMIYSILWKNAESFQLELWTEFIGDSF